MVDLNKNNDLSKKNKNKTKKNNNKTPSVFRGVFFPTFCNCEPSLAK